MTRIAALELKSFLAGRGVIAALLLVFAAGLVAIEHGRRLIAHQQEVLAAAPQLEAEHQQKLLRLHSASLADGPGEVLYYLNFFTGRQPSRFAPIAIGLRDVTPYNLKVRMLALEGQLYDSEIGNPETQALGNFDLAFLLALVYPLIVVAFLHNVLSAEIESGTWSLIGSFPLSGARLLAFKATLRMLPILAVWLATVAAAVVRLDLPLDARLASWAVVSVLYLMFWFCGTLALAALGRSTTFNALALLSCWLSLAILIPASINLGVSAALPASSALEIAVKQREGYHGRWDRSRTETLTAFYARYPEHASSHLPDDRFSWGWYYAMQHMGDEEASAAARDWTATLRAREIWTRRLSLLSPPALVLSAMSEVASTGLSSHLAYLDSVRSYHERVRRFFYPLMFRTTPAPAVDWRGVPRHSFTDESLPVSVRDALARMLLLAAGAGLAAIIGVRRKIEGH